MITWDTQITVVNIVTKTISMTAIRTDDSDPDNPNVFTVRNRHINTAAEKIAIMDEIWAMHVASESRGEIIATLIGNLESQANTNLEAREV